MGPATSAPVHARVRKPNIPEHPQTMKIVGHSHKECIALAAYPCTTFREWHSPNAAFHFGAPFFAAPCPRRPTLRRPCGRRSPSCLSRASRAAVGRPSRISLGAPNEPNHAPVIHEFFVAPAVPVCLSTLTLGIIAIRSVLQPARQTSLNWRSAPERFLRNCSKSCGRIGAANSGSAMQCGTRTQGLRRIRTTCGSTPE